MPASARLSFPAPARGAPGDVDDAVMLARAFTVRVDLRRGGSGGGDGDGALGVRWGRGLGGASPPRIEAIAAVSARSAVSAR